MKLRSPYFLVYLAALLVFVAASVLSTGAEAGDIRQAVQKAEADQAASMAEARQAEADIINDRDVLLAEVLRLEKQQADLEAELRALAVRLVEGRQQRETLEQKWSTRELGFREISGNVRMAVRDLESLLKASPLSAGNDWRFEVITPLLDTGYFPDIDDITGMAGIFFDEMQRGGEVSLNEGIFVGRDGEAQTGRIYHLGKFTTIYQTDEEAGFLNWSPDGRRLFALGELPPGRVAGSIKGYLSGESDRAPVDMSSGAALRQLTQGASLMDQLRAGGPIVYPIMLIALAALFLIIYKIIFLHRLHSNTDRLMGQVTELAGKGDWVACDEIFDGQNSRQGPVIRVLKAGLGSRNEPRETLESVLQESILRELPGVQRGIAILAVLGAVAPLMGLLGTVTGMIDTFRIITLFGTSDPKLMSGGISEALVTTELGLVVAIPIMLFHTVLSRRSDHIIGDMEEKAVQLTNIIEKRKLVQAGAAGR
jgi:biopolymer transport protein ExbB